MDYKKTLYLTSIAFMAVLLTFTFFSQTLTDLRIARVNLVFAETRIVVPEIHSSGTVEPLNKVMLFAPADGTIVQVAEPGYRALSASVLFTIHSDLQSLQELLLQAQDEQRLIMLNTERVQNDRAMEQQRAGQILAESPAAPGLVEYELQLVSNTNQLDIARRELAESQALFAQGLTPRQTVTEREDALAALELAREEILTRRGLAEAAQATLAADQDRARAAQLSQSQAAISQLDLQLRIHALEAERIRQRIEELDGQIYGDGIIEVRAGDNLTALELMPGIVPGARVSEAMPVMRTAVRDGRFRVTAPFGQNIPYIDSLEEMRPAYIHFGAQEIIGRVARIFPEGDMMMVAVDVENTRFSGGERAMMRIQGTGTHSRQAIPRSALREDGQGFYMLYVEAEERLFGISYYARVRRISAIDARSADGFVAAGLDFFESPITAPIIANSDRPVLAGDRVRPVEVGDFFETR